MFIVTFTLGRDLSEFLIVSWPCGRRGVTSPAYLDEETVAQGSPEGPSGAPSPEEDCHHGDPCTGLVWTQRRAVFGGTPLHPDST